MSFQLHFIYKHKGGLFLLLALTHIEFLRSARLDEHGKFCSELYWGLFTILENNITNGNASHSSWVALKTHVNLCAFVRIESMVILHIGADIQLLIRSYSCSCVPFFFQVLTYLSFYYKLFSTINSLIDEHNPPFIVPSSITITFFVLYLTGRYVAE